MTPDKPMVDNAADPQQVRDAKRKAKRERDRELADVKSIMETQHGRRFIWRLLERAGIYRSSFAPDPHLTAFKEGARNEGLKLLTDIHESCPALYQTMLTESQATSRQV